MKAALVASAVMLSMGCARSKAVVQGVDIPIETIERLDLWQGYPAKPGQEFVVVHVAMDAKGIEDELTLPAPSLENADGSRGVTPIRELTVSGGAEHEAEIGFAVSKGATPRTLVFGELRLEVSSAPR